MTDQLFASTGQADVHPGLLSQIADILKSPPGVAGIIGSTIVVMIVWNLVKSGSQRKQ